MLTIALRRAKVVGAEPFFPGKTSLLVCSLVPPVPISVVLRKPQAPDLREPNTSTRDGRGC